ncbi:Protein CBR-SRD-73 [Caenorhabditis briggsae]|uniref:Protein CBR-SRD-73 n=1 Tax=Caenorhabditis briggsae TaxID=6238 RepID=A8WPM1_CAEBR|nr:Protein CBR-SRD-73 [Caenorhabditis briggsae]CAP22428.2 Protein CBR-SRD-73 [Caenorhabditis briggsae]
MREILNQLTAIYYPIFFIFCLILHILLFYLIYFKTTKVLRNMRYFLYPSNFINFFLAFLTFFLQFRNVHNVKSLAIMCQGPCKFLGPAWCFHGYIFILATATAGGILNIHTLYYRLISIKFIQNLSLRVFIFGLWYIFPLVIIGLGLQIMIPLICYVPVGFFYVYNKYSGEQIQISQYTLCFMITLPAFFDPILQIYFIVPYRRAVKRMISQMITENLKAMSVSIQLHFGITDGSLRNQFNQSIIFRNYFSES